MNIFGKKGGLHRNFLEIEERISFIGYKELIQNQEKEWLCEWHDLIAKEGSF